MKVWSARAGSLAASLLAGAVHGLAFGATHPPALQWGAVTILGGIVFLLRSRRDWGVLFLCCTAFWLASYAVGLRWIADALVSNHSLGLALGLLTYGMLVVGLSLLSILCLWVAALLCASLRWQALSAATYSSALLVADWLREVLLPSFPWLAVGYAHVEGPLAALLPIVGVPGVSWIAQFTALLFGALGASLATRRLSKLDALAAAAVAAITAIIALAPIPIWTHDQGALRVAAMQTAVPQREKFRASLFGKHLAEIGDFARDHEAQLILTPETAVPTTVRALTRVQEQFLARSVSPTRTLLFGAFAEDSRGDVFNSAVMLQRAATAVAVQRTVYIKQHLAPVGEYAPPGLRWVAELLNLKMSNLRATADAPQNFSAFGVTIIPSICQDLLYAEDLRTTSSSARVLVNLSNIAFFLAPLVRVQFLNIARARALEQQIPVLIAANYGPTAFIDPSGVIARQLPAGVPGALEMTIHPRAGTTPFAHFGNVFLYVITTLTLVAPLAVAVGSLAGSRPRPPPPALLDQMDRNTGKTS